MSDFGANNRTICPKKGEICANQVNLQLISLKSDSHMDSKSKHPNQKISTTQLSYAIIACVDEPKRYK